MNSSGQTPNQRPSVEAHHRVNGPNTGKNSGGKKSGDCYNSHKASCSEPLFLFLLGAIIVKTQFNKHFETKKQN